MLLKIVAVTIMMMTLLPAIVAAKDNGVTVYAGFRDGGSFTDAASGESLSLDGSGAASVA